MEKRTSNHSINVSNQHDVSNQVIFGQICNKTVSVNTCATISSKRHADFNYKWVSTHLKLQIQNPFEQEIKTIG